MNSSRTGALECLLAHGLCLCEIRSCWNYELMVILSIIGMYYTQLAEMHIYSLRYPLRIKYKVC